MKSIAKAADCCGAANGQAQCARIPNDVGSQVKILILDKIRTASQPMQGFPACSFQVKMVAYGLQQHSREERKEPRGGSKGCVGGKGCTSRPGLVVAVSALQVELAAFILKALEVEVAWGLSHLAAVGLVGRQAG